jgi:hypothetical protein
MGPVLTKNHITAKEPVIKKLGYGGLCLSCQKSGQCTFPRDVSRPVIFCEEHQGYMPVFEPVNEKRLMSMAVSLVAEKAPEKEPSCRQGICENCVRSANCTYPRKDGGIWSCDDYMEEI